MDLGSAVQRMPASRRVTEVGVPSFMETLQLSGNGEARFRWSIVIEEGEPDHAVQPIFTD